MEMLLQMPPPCRPSGTSGLTTAAPVARSTMAIFPRTRSQCSDEAMPRYSFPNAVETAGLDCKNSPWPAGVGSAMALAQMVDPSCRRSA